MDRCCRLPAERPGAVSARILALLALLAGVLAFSVEPVRAVQVDIGPESITLEAKYNKPAFFPHRRHQGWYGCTACHHAKDQVMTIDTCESCHNDAMKNDELNSLRKASHVMCKGCHRRERDKGRTAAPTQCRSCHGSEATAKD